MRFKVGERVRARSERGDGVEIFCGIVTAVGRHPSGNCTDALGNRLGTEVVTVHEIWPRGDAHEFWPEAAGDIVERRP